MAIIHRIGLPENDSESRAIAQLGKRLPEDCFVFHNFELSTGRGLPYEYDIAVLTPHAVYHLEVKGYRGQIRGNQLQWVFENGGVYPSPIPLADKLRRYSPRLDEVFVETLVVLTDDRARVKIKDDQADRVVHLGEAVERLDDPTRLPVSTRNLEPLFDMVCEAMFTTKPAAHVKQIGLYDIVEKIDQDDRFTLYLAKHRYITTQPYTALKVFHFDVYAKDEDKQYRLREIFHGQDAVRILGSHPNLLRTGDMFAWNDDTFVEPVEYLERGQYLETLLGKGADRKLTWQQKSRIIRGVAAGLAHAHRRGLVHRDVRPRNILVAPNAVKLANFDLAFIPDAPNLSIARSVRSHFDPLYVAPAVWLKPRDVAPASDVYSLGLVFYQLITGEPPCHSVEAVLAGKGPAIDGDLLLRELNRGQGPASGLDMKGAAEVIAGMCAPERSQRYPTMDEVLSDLSIVDG